MIARERILRTGFVYGADDAEMEKLPEISRSNEPYIIGPEEYECGCIAVTHITDRDLARGDEPFEMRLAWSCGLGDATCEVIASRLSAIEANRAWMNRNIIGRSKAARRDLEREHDKFVATQRRKIIELQAFAMTAEVTPIPMPYIRDNDVTPTIEAD